MFFFLGFEWTSNWRLDLEFTNCDQEGWSYATDFWLLSLHQHQQTARKARRTFDFVRRRKWYRMMQTAQIGLVTSRAHAPETHSLLHSVHAQQGGSGYVKFVALCTEFCACVFIFISDLQCLVFGFVIFVVFGEFNDVNIWVI